MQALWGRDRATAREVHAAVEEATGWSYSTVRTVLSRLSDKGAVSEEKQGKQLVYAAEVSQDEARRSALRSLVDKAFGGTFGSLVQHLAAEERLSKADRGELERLLAEERSRSGGKRP